jgi:hypothetical protein
MNHELSVLVTGTLSDGLVLFGPFPSCSAAVEWATSKKLDTEWHTAYLSGVEGSTPKASLNSVVIMMGDFKNGFEFIGPFEDRRKAEKWLKTQALYRGICVDTTKKNLAPASCFFGKDGNTAINLSTIIDLTPTGVDLSA